jgi:flagellar L-ring protein precursor FlgH
MRAWLLPAFAGLALALLGGCANTVDRLMHVGQAPQLTPIENPTAQPSYRPVSLPMPTQEPQVYPANSLWRQGARSFFKDQRARAIGDVLTVQVTIADEATFQSQSQRSRDNADHFAMPQFFGYQSKLDKIFPIPTIWSI